MSSTIGMLELARNKRARANSSELTVRKSAGAIQSSDSMSLLQRKLFIALLRIAYDELPNFSIATHRIDLKTLSYRVGFDSKNTQYLKDALTGLVTTPVQWDILQEDGKSAWTVSATLASATIIDGLVEYSFSHEMRKRLYNPVSYGLISEVVAMQLKSRSALNLYENLMVFIERGELETDTWSMPVVRGLLGVAGDPHYEENKRLMEKVVRPACKELNRVAPFTVAPEAERAGKHMVGLRFCVEMKDEVSNAFSPAGELHGRDSELLMLIQQHMGLSYPIVVKLFNEYTDDRLRAVYKYVVQRAREGKVKAEKIGGYFLTTVKNATDESLMMRQSTLFLEPEKSPEATKAADEARQEQEDAATRKAEFRARVQAVEAKWLLLSDERKNALHAQFQAHLASENEIVFHAYKKAKFAGPTYEKSLFEYLLNVEL